MNKEIEMIGEILEDGTIEKGQSDQGIVYKNQEAFDSKVGVCYVPELSDMEYTYQSFFEIGNDDDVARMLFEGVDWQHPESLYEEYLSIDELHLCEKCKKAYRSYEVYKCPHCANPKEL